MHSKSGDKGDVLVWGRRIPKRERFFGNFHPNYTEKENRVEWGGRAHRVTFRGQREKFSFQRFCSLKLVTIVRMKLDNPIPSTACALN